MPSSQQHGPWALVVGGSEGVGAAFAEQLAHDGLNVVLVARTASTLADTATGIRALGVEVRTIAVDLLADDATAQIADATSDIAVGLLILNAGANTYGHDFVSGDLDRLSQMVTLNISRQLELVHHFGGPMAQRGRGGIILVGSLAGYLGTAHESVYAGAKAFSRVFAEGLWAELQPHGVDVLELVLGVTRTPAMERAGLRFDLPGLNVAEPADVAAEGLAHLADGPVWVAGGNYEAAQKRSRFPRNILVRKASDAIAAMMGR
ncbi:SDR family NAD(P)-dependent oxidoreductase [Gordonia sp. TBRC 11910]|uniref:SDR family NAD(P)-dependent oxidoreductase n=1 Tax=Gordonia asplenii TaxID=2725283 RepID=A0A848L060_9ACTN|nr:SDR family NAD(P)-dependent oxidoreductase [Gordonia asplenii]NMO04069.1 SDR family NAD(P)-dependent oxidoreductase [Gordonia asplenii]